MLVASVVSDSLQLHGLYSVPGSSVHGVLQARILEWVSSTGERFPSPGVLLNPLDLLQGSNSGLLHYRQILYHLSYQRSPHSLLFRKLLLLLLVFQMLSSSPLLGQTFSLLYWFIFFIIIAFTFLLIFKAHLSVLHFYICPFWPFFFFFLLVALLWANNQFVMINLLLLILYTDQLSFLFLPDYSV